MDWDTLQRRWHQQPAAAPDAELADVLDGNERLRRKVGRRDWVETSAAAIVAVAFGLFAWRDAGVGNWLAAAFALFVVSWACWLPFRLRRSRLPEIPRDLPMRNYLQRQGAALREQARMLESVWRWYVLPPMLGAAAHQIAAAGFSSGRDVGYLVFLLLFSAAIVWLNRHVARTHFRAAADRVEEQLRRIAD